MKTARPSPDSNTWITPEELSANLGLRCLWWDTYWSSVETYTNYYAAAKSGNGPSVDRMETFATAVALARLKGEL